MQYSLISTLIVAAATFVSAAPTPQANSIAAQNIPLAINENKSFASLTANSPCDAATTPQACINGQFVQCVGGAFSAPTPCAGGTQCFSLPLLLRAGTSITCTTPDDAVARMGLSSISELSGGAPAAAPQPAPVADPAPVPAAAPAPPAGSTASQSIPLAIAENQKFKSLSAASSCDPAVTPQACINGGFAQCVGSTFSTPIACAGGLKCFSLPLLFRVGTSVTCTTPEDAAARMGVSVGSL